MSNPSVLIIGAGIGGLATAIQLAQQRIKVTILEKKSQPGGRCGQIVKDGHVFDTGPTMFIFPEIYTRFFSSIGENVDDHLKLLRSEPAYKLHYPDQTHFTLTSDQQIMRRQLELLEPGSFKRYLDYQQIAQNHYDLTVNQILKTSFANPLSAFRINLFSLFNSNALSNHVAHVNRFFHHPHLIAAFSFQDSYLSLNPFESPAIYSSFSFTEQTHGNYLPEGGMYQVILALEKIAKKHGVEIKYKHEVKQIVIQDNQATGVILTDDHHLSADTVVVNAELPYAYQHLLPNSAKSQKLLKKKYSCSALVFHWGMDKIFPELQTHNLFFSENYQAGFNQVLNQATPPPNPHFYIQAPARIDSTRAPKHHDTLTVMVPINHLDSSHPVDWHEYQLKTRKYIIDRLVKSGLTDIESHIKFEKTFMPPDWQSRHHLPFGAIYGLHHNLAQLGPFRPSRIHDQYRNLFFVGASTHPGSGLPTVLLSSQFTTQAMLQSKSLRSYIPKKPSNR